MVTINWQQNLVSSYSVSYVMSDWQSLLWLHTELDFTRSYNHFWLFTWNFEFLGVYVNQNFNFKVYKGGIDFHVNKWIHVFNTTSPIEDMNIYAFHYFL